MEGRTSCRTWHMAAYVALSSLCTWRLASTRARPGQLRREELHVEVDTLSAARLPGDRNRLAHGFAPRPRDRLAFIEDVSCWLCLVDGPLGGRRVSAFALRFIERQDLGESSWRSFRFGRLRAFALSRQNRNLLGSTLRFAVTRWCFDRRDL